jgi:hypothetical protein
MADNDNDNITNFLPKNRHESAIIIRWAGIIITVVLGYQHQTAKLDAIASGQDAIVSRIQSLNNITLRVQEFQEWTLAAQSANRSNSTIIPEGRTVINRNTEWTAHTPNQER